MKTEQQVNEARSILCNRLAKEVLDEQQRILLQGMLNALVWCADGEHQQTMQDVLDNRPIAKRRTS